MAESFFQTYLRNLKEGFSGGAKVAGGIAKAATKPIVTVAATPVVSLADSVNRLAGGKGVSSVNLPIYGQVKPGMDVDAIARGDSKALMQRGKEQTGQVVEAGLTVGSMGTGKLVSAGTRLAPAAKPLVQKGVQGAVDFGVGAFGSAASDIAAGRDVDVKQALKSGALSSVLPIAAEVGVKGVSKATNFSSKKLSNTLAKKEQEYAAMLSKSDVPKPIKVAGTDLEIPGQFQMSKEPSFKKKVIQTKLDLVRGLQDLRTNFIDDRAPITSYFSSEMKKAGAPDEEVNAVIQATRNARAADSRGMSKVLDWQDRFKGLNQGKNISEQTSLLNEYADIRTKLDTPREYAGADIDRAALEGRLNEIETTLPPKDLADLQQAHKELVLDFNSKQLDEDVASGLRSPEEAARLRETNPNYSRLIVKDYLDEAVSRGNARRDAKGIKFFGRKTEAAINPETLPATEANIIASFTRERQRARNTEALTVLDADARAGTGKFIRLDEVPEDKTGVVEVLRNGQREYYQTTDRRLADYFANETKKDDNIVASALRFGADATRLFATGINPAFSIANLARDYQNAKLNLPANVDLSMGDMLSASSDAFAYKFPRLFGKGNKTPEAIKEAYRLGGPLATLAREVRENPSIISKEVLNKKPSWDLITQLKDFSEASEITTRLAVLRAAKRSGVTDKDALRNMMRDATVDFEVGGKTIREINRMIPFLNARIQGARNLIKAFGDDPASVARKLNYYSILPTIALEAWNKRFASYASVPESEKNNFYSIVIGEGKDASGIPFAKRITIPKGQGQALASAWARVLDDDSIPDKMKGQFLAASLLDLAPLDQVPILGGSIAQALQSWVTNTNYRGEYVVPPSLVDEPARNQVTATTSPTAVKLSRALGRLTGGTETKQGAVEPSPIQMENFFRTMTSGFGSSVLSGADYASKVAEEKTLFPSYLKNASGAALASKLPILQSFARVSNRAVPAAIAKQNAQFAETRSLMSANKKAAAQKFINDVRTQPTPEARKAKIAEYQQSGALENGELLKEAEKLIEKKNYIYGVDPNATPIVRAQQINNYVSQFSETEQQISVLKDIQQSNIFSEDTKKALIARKLVDKLNELDSPDERRTFLESMKGKIDEKILGYMAEYKKIEQASQ